MNIEVDAYLKKVLKDNPELLESESQRLNKWKNDMREQFEASLKEGLKLKQTPLEEQEKAKNELNRQNEWSKNYVDFRRMIMEFAREVNSETIDDFMKI